MNSVSDYLATLLTAEVESSGSFSLQREVALRKLSLYRLNRSEDWLVAAASALQLGGATWARLSFGLHDVTLRHNAPPLPNHLLDSLASIHLEPECPREQVLAKHLEIAMLGAFGEGAVSFVDRRPKLEVTWTRDFQRNSRPPGVGLMSPHRFEVAFVFRFKFKSKAWRARLLRRWRQLNFFRLDLRPESNPPEPPPPHAFYLRGQHRHGRLPRRPGVPRVSWPHSPSLEVHLQPGARGRLIPVVAGKPMDAVALPPAYQAKIWYSDWNLPTNASWSGVPEAHWRPLLDYLLPAAYREACIRLARRFSRLHPLEKSRYRDLLCRAMELFSPIDDLLKCKIVRGADREFYSLQELDQDYRQRGYLATAGATLQGAGLLGYPVVVMEGVQAKLLERRFPLRRDAEEAVLDRRQARQRQLMHATALPSRPHFKSEPEHRIPLDGLDGELAWFPELPVPFVDCWRRGRFLLRWQRPWDLPHGLGLCVENDDFRPDLDWLALEDADRLHRSVFHTVALLLARFPQLTPLQEWHRLQDRHRFEQPEFLGSLKGAAVAHVTLGDSWAVAGYRPGSPGKALVYRGAGPPEALELGLPPGFELRCYRDSDIPGPDQLERVLAELVELVKDVKSGLCTRAFIDLAETRGPFRPALNSLAAFQTNRGWLTLEQLRERLNQQLWMAVHPRMEAVISASLETVLVLDPELLERTEAWLGEGRLRAENGLLRRLSNEARFLERPLQPVPAEPRVTRWDTRFQDLEVHLSFRGRALGVKRLPWPVARVQVELAADRLTPTSDWNDVVEDRHWSATVATLHKLLEKWLLLQVDDLPLLLKGVAWSPRVRELCWRKPLLPGSDGQPKSLAHLSQVVERRGWVSYLSQPQPEARPELILRRELVAPLETVLEGRLHRWSETPARNARQTRPQLERCRWSQEIEGEVLGRRASGVLGIGNNLRNLSRLYLRSDELEFEPLQVELPLPLVAELHYAPLYPDRSLQRPQQNAALDALLEWVERAAFDLYRSHLDKVDLPFQIAALAGKWPSSWLLELEEECRFEDILGVSWSARELRQRSSDRFYYVVGENLRGEDRQMLAILSREMPVPVLRPEEREAFVRTFTPCENLTGHLETLRAFMEREPQLSSAADSAVAIRDGHLKLLLNPDSDSTLELTRWQRRVTTLVVDSPLPFQARLESQVLLPATAAGGCRASDLLDKLRERVKKSAASTFRSQLAEGAYDRHPEFCLGLLKRLSRRRTAEYDWLHLALSRRKLFRLVSGAPASLEELEGHRDPQGWLEGVSGSQLEGTAGVLEAALERRPRGLLDLDTVPTFFALELEPLRDIGVSFQKELLMVGNRLRAAEVSMEAPAEALFSCLIQRRGYLARISLTEQDTAQLTCTVGHRLLHREVAGDHYLQMVIDGPFQARSDWSGLERPERLTGLLPELERGFLLEFREFLSRPHPWSLRRRLLARMSPKLLLRKPRVDLSETDKSILNLPFFPCHRKLPTNLAELRDVYRSSGGLRYGPPRHGRLVLDLSLDQAVDLESLLEIPLSRVGEPGTEPIPCPWKESIQRALSRSLVGDTGLRMALERLVVDEDDAGADLLSIYPGGQRPVLNLAHPCLVRLRAALPEEQVVWVLASMLFSTVNRSNEILTDAHEREFHSRLVSELVANLSPGTPDSDPSPVGQPESRTGSDRPGPR